MPFVTLWVMLTFWWDRAELVLPIEYGILFVLHYFLFSKSDTQAV